MPKNEDHGDLDVGGSQNGWFSSKNGKLSGPALPQ